ncbi:MAG TPA: hypothetical protein VMY37_25715 [Thermoguttaceae bacterium]|nr:hypothetical protein [Thermoguttaceae bacterium]
MKCRLLIDMGCNPSPDFPNGIKPAGTVIEHRDAYKLVLMGVAESVDDECRVRAPSTPEQAARRLDAYKKLDAGVTPEDREAWDRGYMRGYNHDGSWIPGPNADELEEKEWEDYKRSSLLVLP